MINKEIIMMETGSPISLQKEGPVFLLKRQAITWLNHILCDDDDTRKLENWKELFDAINQYHVAFCASDWMIILNDDIIGSYTKQKHPDIFDNILKALPTNPSGYPMLLNESTRKYSIYIEGEWIEEKQSEEHARMEELLANLNIQIEEVTNTFNDIKEEGKDFT